MGHQVDIIIRARNGHELTGKCIASLDQIAVPYKLWMIDDGSEPPYALVSKRHPDPLGAVSATNTGLRCALTTDAPYILVLDNDTEIPAGDTTWLKRMIAELEQDPRNGAVGAVTDNCAWAQQCLSIPQTYTADWKDEKTGNGGIKDNPEVAAFVSFAVLLRKQAVRECGMWDERYNPGNWEDTDYSLTLRTHGWKVKVARSVWIHHHCHQTFGDALGELIRVNQRKFIEKWGLGRLWDLGIVPDREIALAAGRRAGIVREE